MNVDGFASKLVRKEVETSYVTSAKHCKYSVSDKKYKRYNHKLYKLLLNVIPDHMSEKNFYIEGIQYRWMTIKEMENDETIMEKNDDIVAFVKSKCS